ncbi:hypothetical protein I553_3643 [Mycobacterium xenopi 4042]|uniref:Uncharacterized protein n=1 Tax=Mycobacterium xenopi 4042 TaxID=1299334 RepID=X7ZAW1_MYCXE|nr:hypothetical protein I553_3643 [Mycobacterium xenopi 4042]
MNWSAWTITTDRAGREREIGGRLQRLRAIIRGQGKDGHEDVHRRRDERVAVRPKPYSVVILKRGPDFGSANTPAIIWEHAGETSRFATRACWRWCFRSRTAPRSAGSACPPDRRRHHRRHERRPGVQAGFSRSRCTRVGFPR